MTNVTSKSNRQQELARLRKNLDDLYRRKMRSFGRSKGYWLRDKDNQQTYQVKKDAPEFGDLLNLQFNQLKARYFALMGESWVPPHDVAIELGESAPIMSTPGNKWLHLQPVPEGESDLPDKLDASLAVAPSPVQGISVKTVVEWCEALADLALAPEIEKLPWERVAPEVSIAGPENFRVIPPHGYAGGNNVDYPTIDYAHKSAPREQNAVSRELPAGLLEFRRILAELFLQIKNGKISSLEDISSILQAKNSFNVNFKSDEEANKLSIEPQVQVKYVNRPVYKNTFVHATPFDSRPVFVSVKLKRKAEVPSGEVSKVASQSESALDDKLAENASKIDKK